MTRAGPCRWGASDRATPTPLHLIQTRFERLATTIMPGSSDKPEKYCFVTIGATAAFDSLITAVFQPRFLRVLCDHGYTDLLVQYGKDGKPLFDNFVTQVEGIEEYDIIYHGFDFNRQGLAKEMRLAKGGNGVAEGVVISHAGMAHNNTQRCTLAHNSCRVWLDTRRAACRRPHHRRSKS